MKHLTPPAELHVVLGGDGSIAAVLISEAEAAAFVGGFAPDVRTRLRLETYERRAPIPTCTMCHRSKAPRGRDVAAAGDDVYCTSRCPGYYDAPEPGRLWPGEFASDEE